MDKNRLKKFKQGANGNSLTVQKELMKIYTNKDGSLTDISQLEVRHQSRLKIFSIGFILVALVLAAIAWLGFLVFTSNGGSDSKSLKLEIKGEQSIASGNEVIYVIEYKNIEKTALNDLEIIVRYPDGFTFVSAEPLPANGFNTSWNLGRLEKNASGTVQIKGKIIGEVGSIKTINATASFKPENFSSIFKETASFSNQITSSILELNIEGPNQILPEKKATYKITYKNNSEQDLGNVKITVIYPSNFIYQDSNPKPWTKEGENNLNNQWLVEKLLPQREGQIEINGGYVVSDQISNPEFKVQIGFIKPDSNDFSLQQEKTILTSLVKSDLNLNLIINGSNQNQPISFDQTLTYSINYKNLGQKDLDDVTISIALDSSILDWSTLDDKHAGKIEGNKITWNKDQISELDLVRPLQEGVIDFSIKVKEAGQVNLDRDNLQVKSKALATMLKIGDLDSPDLKVESSEILNNINTDLELKVEGRYFDDDNIAVGSGPLPPVVGQKTTFRILWYVANSMHEVNNVEISTELPEGVQWENKFLVKAGELNYNSKENKITWKINRIPANKGFNDVNVWFDISVTPTKQQVRKLLILTDQTDLVATDKDTNSPITKTGKAITSNLEDDPIGGGKGLVVDITE
jgi:hypothetical protein